jgi:hypothetical protein
MTETKTNANNLGHAAKKSGVELLREWQSSKVCVVLLLFSYTVVGS